jgi:nucleotide-binding universal stress UspA family protein
MSETPQRILLATDGSEGASLASRRATKLARDDGAELYVTHIFPVEEHYDNLNPGIVVDEGPLDKTPTGEDLRKTARELLDEQVRLMEEGGGEVTRAYLREGHPEEEIVELAEELDADTVVIGSRGSGRVGGGSTGSVAESVVNNAHCTVLVVRK